MCAAGASMTSVQLSNLTTGRDLRLGPDHAGPSLNYFVYPHVEVGGVVFDGPIEKSFGYREVAEPVAAVR